MGTAMPCPYGSEARESLIGAVSMLLKCRPFEAQGKQECLCYWT